MDVKINARSYLQQAVKCTYKASNKPNSLGRQKAPFAIAHSAFCRR